MNEEYISSFSVAGSRYIIANQQHRWTKCTDEMNVPIGDEKHQHLGEKDYVREDGIKFSILFVFTEWQITIACWIEEIKEGKNGK